MKSKVFSCDIRLAGTVYVRAKTLKQAKEMVAALYGDAMQIVDGKYEDVVVSSARYDDPKLPKVSLSPCFTLHHAWTPLRLVHEDKNA